MPLGRARALFVSPLRPTWSWDFTRGAVPPGATFSRGSGATQFGSDGMLCWAPENLLSNSNVFNGSGWSLLYPGGGGQGVLPILTLGYAPGPDGVAGAASRLQCALNATTGGDDVSYLVQNNSQVGCFQAKVWLKSNTASDQTVGLRVGAGVGAASQVLTVTPTWQQFAVTDLNGGGSAQFNLGLRNGLTGNGPMSCDILVAYAQVCRYPNASTTYVTTGNSPYFGPRFDHDPAKRTPLGYLSEMQSTNACQHSTAIHASTSGEQHLTVTDNAIVSPDGTQNASALIEDATTNTHLWSGPSEMPVSSGSAYGFSYFVKNISGARWIQVSLSGGWVFNFQPSTGIFGAADVNGSASVWSQKTARFLANGWYRVSALLTAASSATLQFRCALVDTDTNVSQHSYAGDGTSGVALWGLQFETAGVGVTSYIPTNGATATRSQDALSLPLNSLPGWDDTKGGMLVSAYRLFTLHPSSPGYNQAALFASAGDYTESIFVQADQGGSGSALAAMFHGGATQFSATWTASSPPFVRRRQATGWSTSRGQGAVDGNAPNVTTGSYTLPVGMNSLSIGRYTDHGLEGVVESVSYYRGARPDAFVQAASR